MNAGAGTASRHSRATVLRRGGTTAICALLLCVFALLAPAAARAGTVHAAHPGHHALRLAAGGAVDQPSPGFRLDHSHLIGAAGQSRDSARPAAVTARSSSIVSPATVDSPRTRGPPVDGCS
jgi:hypothetical protein